MEKRLKKAKEGIIESAPNIGEVIRGTFRKVYLECIRENCKCHKGKKYRHGPFYRISYGKGKKIHTVYITKDKKEQAKMYTENYRKLWEAIEKISQINIQLLKIRNGRKR
jgi:hypothetical protein